MVLPILIMAAVSLAEVTSPASVSSFNNGGLPPMAAGMIKSPSGQPHAPMKGAVEVCTKLIGDDDSEDARQDQNNPTVAPPSPSPINNYTLAGMPAPPPTPIVKPVAATAVVSVVTLFLIYLCGCWHRFIGFLQQLGHRSLQCCCFILCGLWNTTGGVTIRLFEFRSHLIVCSVSMHLNITRRAT